MDKRASLLLALVVIGMFPAMTMNAWLNRPAEYTEQGAINAALFYLKNSPTFKYDGILESINVTEVYRARTPIPTWLVVIEFDCLHSGYGDRAGLMLLQIISPHEIMVIVEEGKVVQALIDGEWDEMAQRARITIVEPEGETSQRISSTASDGTYTDTFTLSLSGVWKVSSTWMGDDTRIGSSSTEVTFNVEEISEPVPEEEKRCIIATATYGSELSPEVQFLRGFRDNYVLKTYAGSSFMTVFNAWYYSFSPQVASAISTSNTLRNIMKILLIPLIGTLHLTTILNYLFGFNEFAIIFSGFIASSLIGVIYIAPFIMIIFYIKKMKVHPRKLRSGSIIWGLSLVGILTAETIRFSSLMMVSTAIFVLMTMILAILFSVKHIKNISNMRTRALKSST